MPTPYRPNKNATRRHTTSTIAATTVAAITSQTCAHLGSYHLTTNPSLPTVQTIPL